MGLFKLLGFGNPLADLLEKELTQVIVDRYQASGKTVTEDISELPKSIRRKFKSELKQLFSAENAKVKKSLREFKSIIEKEEKDIITIVLKNSLVKNYSNEKSWEIIAVPKDLLSELTTDQLPAVLKNKMEFVDMKDATRLALAKYAVEIKFDSIMSSLKRDKEILKIEIRDYLYVGEIKNDYYYIDNNEKVMRKTMLFFSEVIGLSYKPNPKEIKNKSKTAIQAWKDHCRDRPDKREFKYAGWQ